MKEHFKFYLFITLATLLVGIGFTSADFFTSPVHNFKDSFILFLQWGILVMALWSVIYLISLNKYVFALLYPLICLFSSILAYFRYTMGTTLTTVILEVFFDNHSQTTLISPILILVVVLSLLCAVLVVIYRFRNITIHHILLNSIIAFLLFVLLFNIPRIKHPLSERIPFNLYFITVQYFSQKKEALTERSVLSKDVTSCGEDQIVVLILGESLRADHLAFNGYERNTTPYLSQEDIISFPTIFSEYTHTNASVPHILTRADSLNPDLAYQERSFVDLLKQCGFYTVWLANQQPNKSYIYFMNECDTLIYANANKSAYVFDKWVDGDLLPAFDSFIQNDDRQFILMHTIGSHWYYNSHFPDAFQKYTPITNSRIVKSNTREEMINSYDNTILYTDYFWHEIINRLRDKKAVLIYLSDHGEALGENGVWLHATDADPIHYPACWIWMSPQYKADNPEKYQALQENKANHYRTDFLFHTILQAVDIQSDVIDATFSLFTVSP
ncbi:MAG: phosphoethanolamine transferase [Candidatus Symbiothrix sp.]|nr:phosphoethanolamine transferase [Candidatus Symbiothrix sp.]